MLSCREPFFVDVPRQIQSTALPEQNKRALSPVTRPFLHARLPNGQRNTIGGWQIFDGGQIVVSQSHRFAIANFPRWCIAVNVLTDAQLCRKVRYICVRRRVHDEICDKFRHISVVYRVYSGQFIAHIDSTVQRQEQSASAGCREDGELNAERLRVQLEGAR